MENDRKVKITSAELAQLWSQYMNDSGSVCVLTFFLAKVEDPEIKSVIEFALRLSKTHIEKLTVFFNQEDYAVPYGFKVEEDVDLSAPKLYTDSYVLQFIHQMAKIGLTNYSASVGSAVRTDITDYYSECVSETMQLYKVSKDLLLAKGLYVRSPFIPNEKVEFVNKQAFLFDVIGEKRPLIVSEVGNLYANIQRNILGVATLIGFSQVSKDREVTKFFLRGIDIGKKHVKVFGAKLEECNLPVPASLSAEVTTSTSYTFSDKLMMFFTTGLIALSIGYYGTGVAQSPRMDLGVMFNRLSLEVQLYSEDGSNIMINNKWLEQPPMAADRGELGTEKK
ncbi:DUF3231 family protein [Neobacillus sp. CF12]|uniref:DUF3231 family protein n=1 Tax=Neobacillus sp. CF12 TaxID=3055864 RepID=UPI0025A11BE2|nr:DUF3231 family protein [Neobacillus sp. CF12]MDM5327173.1 DUF3231 family protein [Neobacillus sp. CF12]